MEAVERWLLLIYLPLLAPLVVLTFFTWPWKVIGHGFRGLAMSLRSTWRGFSRSRHNHRRRPFSLWRNMFLGCWSELARQQEMKHGSSMTSSGHDLPPAYTETLLEATRETQSRICSGLRASAVMHSIFAAFLFMVLTRAMHAGPDIGNGRNSVAIDLCGLFAGLAFLLSLAIVGVYMQLTSLLTAAGTPQQFYWFICSWERAGSGGQLATACIISFTFVAGLSAAFELFSDWVFTVLLFSASTLLYGYIYFWADSMWCPTNGAYVHYSQAFHRDLLDKEALLAHPSCCAFWELEPVMGSDARGSLYDRMDRYLWRESQVAWYIGSSGGAALGQDTSIAGGQELYKPGRMSPQLSTGGGGGGGGGAPMVQASMSAGGGAPSTTAAAAAAASGSSGRSAQSDPALYSSWPSLLRYTSSSAAKLQGRNKRGSNSGLQAVAEGPGYRPGTMPA